MFFESIKNIHLGQTAYIIGKGESLQNLTNDVIGDGIVITLNSAIEVVEKLNLPNKIYSLQKDKYVSRVKENVTLLMHKEDEFHSAANDSKETPEYIEFSCEEFGMPNVTFSAIVAVEMAKQMGCARFCFISFDSVTTNNLKTFDVTKPYYPKAYVIQAEIMQKHVKALNHVWITPKAKKVEETIVLITPTGGRVKQIQLCAKWMKAQTYTGNVIWVIVDDCEPQTTEFITKDFKEDWTIIHHTPTPLWKSGDNTQARNIKAGLAQIPEIPIAAIFIIEDDDYYSPKYLQIMMLMLGDFDLCGEKNTIYYNVAVKAARQCHNMQHSSLFQTAFKPSVIPYLEKILSKKVMYIDIELFKAPVKINLFEGLNLSIGIKGLQGRRGIGNGHSVEQYPTRIINTSPKLTELIGEDAIHYQNT